MGLIAGLALAAGCLTVCAAPVGIASAQSIVALPISSFYQIVADPSVGYLFFSSPDDNEIFVTNLSGQEVNTIGSQDGVEGIALSPDGSTLYAALGTGDAVTAISTSTLAETASYALPAGDAPQDVAVQSGKVWVSYGTGAAGEAAIGDIDLTATSPAFETQANMGNWYSAPELAADPQDSGVLAAADPDLEPPPMATYDVTANPATKMAQGSPSICNFEADLAVVPGGSQVILTCPEQDGFLVYSTADLSQDGSYPNAADSVAVAIDANGDVAAGTISESTDPDLYVYAQGSDSPLNTYDLASTGGNLAARGLAWNPDGSQLFAVTDLGSSYVLQVVDAPAIPPSTLTLTGPSTAQATQAVMLTGSLTVGSGTEPPAGTPISITRSETGSTAVRDFSVSTAADGSFSLSDAPPGAGQYTYTASYAGSATTAAASASFTLTLTLAVTSLSITASPHTATYEPTVRVIAHLGATDTNRTVSIYAEIVGTYSRRLVETGKVNASGDLVFSERLRHSTTFTAVFSGDAAYAAATASRTAYVRARVTESLTGYYRTKRISGKLYHLVHRKKIMRVHVTVAPNKSGECVEFDVRQFYQGAWRGEQTACAILSSASKVTLTVTFAKSAIGHRFRIRADYIAGIDTSNEANDSSWVYFLVEK